MPYGVATDQIGTGAVAGAFISPIAVFFLKMRNAIINMKKAVRQKKGKGNKKARRTTI
ncbi:hypothetical protein [Affinibrenneria salicis]|uniref:hypothetical protein n=1 Tax=Affinibrenneria salicis TaxID=2590031 RepID=UPI00168AAF1C|nr:hypothetical protein [Affinibrenneria salicis]